MKLYIEINLGILKFLDFCKTTVSTTSKTETTAVKFKDPFIDIYSTKNNTDSLKEILDILSSEDYDLTGCLVNCTNQGLCMLDSSIRRYICKCSTFYIGSSCQTDTRPCSTMPCLNNGTCVNKNNFSQILMDTDKEENFECVCNSDFFYGQYCEIRVDLCLNKTCSMHGYCSIQTQTNEAKCNCFDGFSGSECEFENIKARIVRDSLKYTSLVAFLASIITFVIFIVGNDVMNFFGFTDRSAAIMKKKSINYDLNKNVNVQRK
jgi:hypothetical protein